MSYRRLFAAEILTRWDQLVSAELESIQPDSTLLAQLLQAHYGFCRDRATREADSFIADFEERLRRAVAA